MSKLQNLKILLVKAALSKTESERGEYLKQYFKLKMEK